MSIENLTAKATVIYTRTVDRAASFLNTKKDLEERSQLKKEKLLSALTKKAPADFLNDAIDKRIAMAQKPKRGEISRASQPAVESAAAFVSTTSSVTMSKDDFAPFVSEAPADDKRAAKKFPGLGKGKGKGKSRAASHFQTKGQRDKAKASPTVSGMMVYMGGCGLNPLGVHLLCMMLKEGSLSMSQFFTTVGKEKPKAERLEIQPKAKERARDSQGDTELNLQQFLRLIRGMSIAEFCCLLQCGLGNDGVYMYSPVRKSVSIPSPGEIPWSVEFVLRMHAKHVYMSRQLPSLQVVSSCLLQWEAKIRWMHVFDKLSCSPQSGNSNRWWKLRDRGPTRPCAARLPDSSELFLQEAKCACMAACARSRSYFRDKRGLSLPICTLWPRMGLKYPRTGPFAAVYADKDGGFALENAVLSQIDMPQNDELVVQPDSLLHDMVPEYVSACQSVGDALGDDDLTTVLLSSLQKGSPQPGGDPQISGA